MEFLAMRLHPRERWKLRQVEQALRKDDPGLDALLAGRSPPGQPSPRRPAPRAWAAGAVAGYVVAPALLIAGLVLHTTWLIVAGAVLCPFIPVIAWMPIRRHVIHRGSTHSREP